MSKGLDRDTSISLVNFEINNKAGLSGNHYHDSKKMLEVSWNILSQESIFILTYAWLRSSLVNTITSPILLDSRVRNMKHPSFTENGNIFKWIKTLLSNRENLAYLNILILSFLLTLISGLGLIMGFYIFVKTNMFLSIISFIIIMYFCLITGPIISPKYCFPYLPIIFYLQAISLDRVLLFIKHRCNSKDN